MLVFLIHGVATQNAGYGDKFKKKVKELILEAKANRDTVAEETIAILNENGTGGRRGTAPVLGSERFVFVNQIGLL